jgi:hypothetical protein
MSNPLINPVACNTKINVGRIGGCVGGLESRYS